MKTKKFRINSLWKVTTIMPQFHWLYSQVSLTSKQQFSIFYGVWFMHKVLVFPCQMYFKSSIFQILDATNWKWPLMQILQQHLTATCESLLCNESQFRKVTLHTCSSLELMSIVSPHYTLSLTQKYIIYMHVYLIPLWIFTPISGYKCISLHVTPESKNCFLYQFLLYSKPQIFSHF